MKAPSSTRRFTVSLVAAMAAAAVPATGAAWLLDRSATSEQRARVDDRLAYALREASRELETTLVAADERGAALARVPAFQRAFDARDRRALERIAGRHDGVAVYRGDVRLAGEADADALRRTVPLRHGGEIVGRIVVSVPIDERLLDALARASALPDGYDVGLVQRGIVERASEERGREITRGAGSALVAGDEYRARSTPVPGGHGLELVALAPTASLEAPLAEYRKRLYGGAGIAILLVAIAAAALRSQISDAVGELRRLSVHATTDGLTGIANRRSFEESLVYEMQRAERSDAPLAVILADVDDFKSVNDRYGHATGDAVLRRFADVIRETVRKIDLPARYGGEEFAVVLPGADEAAALMIAERIRTAFAAEGVECESGLVSTTASFGVALFELGETATTLLDRADVALYRAKRDGKNRVVTASLEPEPEPSSVVLVERPASA